MKLRAIMSAAVLLLVFACQRQVGLRAPKPGAERLPPLIGRVHFLTGSARPLREERWMIEHNARWIERNPDAVLILEGHCDERGSDEFNMELGDRRSRAIKALLIGRGVDSDRLVLLSHGEKRPLDRRHVPGAWEKNRRVEFVLR